MTASTPMKYPFKGTEPCGGAPTGVFFDDYDAIRTNSSERPRYLQWVSDTYCNKCPLMKTGECHQWALKHEQYGIWAGRDANQRDEDRKLFGIRYEGLLTLAFRNHYKEEDHEA